MKRTESADASKSKPFEETVVERIVFDGSDGPALPQDDLSRRRWINDIVEQSEQSDTLLTREENGVSWHWRNRRFAILAVSLAACLLVGVLFFGNQQILPSVPAVAEPTSASNSRIAMVTGNVRITNTALSANHPLRAGEQIRTEGGATAVQLAGGVVVYLQPHSIVTLTQPNIQPAQIQLDTGRIVSAVDKSPTGEVAFVVDTHAGRIEVTGTLFAVESRSENVDLQVLKGTVRVAHHETVTLEVSGGQGILLGDKQAHDLSTEQIATLSQSTHLLSPFRSNEFVDAEPASPQAPHIADDTTEPIVPQKRASAISDVALPQQQGAPPAPADPNLLTQARQQRQVKNWNGAVQTYELILQRSTDPSETGVALTALGDMLLEHQNNPSSALNYFGQYLTQFPTGPLAQEAAFGRIRALQQLNRTTEEASSLAQFIQTYPNAVQSALAQKRLAELNTAIHKD